MRTKWKAGMVAALLVLAAVSCGDDEVAPLQLSGTVRAAETDGALAGAAITIWSTITHSGMREVLGQAVTDNQGRYSLRVRAPRSYAVANCTVMDAVVSLHGYVTLEQRLQFHVTQADSCTNGGRATAHFVLFADPAGAARLR